MNPAPDAMLIARFYCSNCTGYFRLELQSRRKIMGWYSQWAAESFYSLISNKGSITGREHNDYECMTLFFETLRESETVHLSSIGMLKSSQSPCVQSIVFSQSIAYPSIIGICTEFSKRSPFPLFEIMFVCESISAIGFDWGGNVESRTQSKIPLITCRSLWQSR